MEINKKLFLIKLHYFLFFGALGPILPYIYVIGKQLQISELVMGTINAILPLACLLAKPGFGFVIDLFHRQRKLLFLILIGVMLMGFCLLAVIPQRCRIECSDHVLPESWFNESSNNSTLRLNVSTKSIDLGVARSIDLAGLTSNASLSATNASLSATNGSSELEDPSSEERCYVECDDEDLYKSWNFWAFAIFTSLGVLGFNIVNSTSDALCFDMLGAGNEIRYGMQRMFGTVGFGLTAMLSGIAIDHFSEDSEIKSYLPAYCLVLLFGVSDLICCSLIRLPRLPHSQSILKDVSKVMKQPYVKSFLAFAVMAGFCEGFMIYNLFWYMEDLAKATGSLHNIKLLQGLTVAAETIFGELLIFFFSDRIIGRLGYGHCLTFCFAAYFLRLGLIAVAPSPWYLLPIELFGQGPTYALSYTCVVAYASAIAPAGTSATMQGVMAGANDGLGFSIASFVGGALYFKIGGSYTFGFFSLTALACAIGHAFVYHKEKKNIDIILKDQHYELESSRTELDRTIMPAEHTKLHEKDHEEDSIAPESVLRD